MVDVSGQGVGRVVRVETVYADGTRELGTGVIVGPNDVLTNAHVVTEGDAPVARITVTPNSFLRGAPPERFEVRDVASGTVRTEGGTIRLADIRRDIALLTVDGIGAAHGWLERQPDAFAEGARPVVSAAGYPGSGKGDLVFGQVQAEVRDGLIEIPSPGDLRGASGGPIWIGEGAAARLVGLWTTDSHQFYLQGSAAARIDRWIRENDPLRLKGGEGDDRLRGRDTDDRLLGAGGDDRLWGGAGNDDLHGGEGDDRLLGGEGDDWLGGEAGRDTLEGAAGDDRLKGGDGDDRLYGGAGDDRLDGAAGADVLKGHAGADLLEGGEGDDRLDGGTGDDSGDGGQGRDVLLGKDGDDILLGRRAGDWLYGGGGDDRLEGNGAGDVLKGHDGHDALYGGRNGDRAEGGDGNDTIALGNGRDFGHGGDGDDDLEGGTGGDVLKGGDRQDRLAGGPGPDRLWGDAHADTFVLMRGDDLDRVVDFEPGRDTLLLDRDLLASRGLSHAATIAQHATVTADGVAFDFGGGDGVVLVGLTSTAGLGGDIDFFS